MGRVRELLMVLKSDLPWVLNCLLAGIVGEVYLLHRSVNFFPLLGISHETG